MSKCSAIFQNKQSPVAIQADNILQNKCIVPRTAVDAVSQTATP